MAKKEKNKKIRNVVACIAIILTILIAYIYYTQASTTEPAGLYQIITLHYADGSSRVLTPKNYMPSLTFIDPDNQQAVVRIQISLAFSADFTGTVTGYTIVGNKVWGLHDYPANTPIADLSAVEPVSLSGGPIVSNALVVVPMGDILVSDLETHYMDWVHGQDYNLALKSTIPFTITLTFGGDTPISREVMPLTAIWHFRYEQPYELNSIYISWTGYYEY